MVVKRLKIGLHALVGVVSSGVACLVLMVPDARAQSTAPQAADQLQEVIVTARKRDESVLKAPVIMQVMTKDQIENLKITDTYSLAAVTPGLMITPAFAASGSTVFMRGLGTGQSGTFDEQSVLLNVDDVSLSHGGFYRIGLFDVGQVETLEGPQALFFGKSASAGIVAITSGDPTSTWEGSATTGYEFHAGESRIDGYVAGPINDKLGVRLAGYYDYMEGWEYNANPDADPHRLGSNESGERLTLKYDDPDVGFQAKLKVNYGESFSRYTGATDSGICAYGFRQVPTYRPYDPCQLSNERAPQPNPNPYNPNVDWFAPSIADLNSFSPVRGNGDGKPYAETGTSLDVLELNYDFARGLRLTSVSGYYDLKAGESINAGLATGTFSSNGQFSIQGYSEELRLASDWKDSWINFFAGGLFNYEQLGLFYGGEALLPPFYGWDQTINRSHNKVTAGFGQIIITPAEQWEIDAGARFTDVRKKATSLAVASYTDFSAPLPLTQYIGEVPSNLSNLHETNTSPEVTLNYHATPNLTAFISYKEGYQGPGFSNNYSGFAPYDPANSYISTFRGETVKGTEGGIKGVALDRHLRFSFTGYYYKYKDLQVGFYNPINLTTITTNGGGAKVQGIEAELTYAPKALENLTLSTHANLNDARYTSFNLAPCWQGQSVADGCVNGAQNLTSQRLAEAPLWTGRIGASYKIPVNSYYNASVDTNANFSSRYSFVATDNPGAIQGFYATVDASFHFGPSTGLWDIALIGRNLTNRFYAIYGGEDALVPSSLNGGNPRADVYAYTNRNRELWLQATVHPRL